MKNTRMAILQLTWVLVAISFLMVQLLLSRNVPQQHVSFDGPTTELAVNEDDASIPTRPSLSEEALINNDAAAIQPRPTFSANSKSVPTMKPRLVLHLGPPKTATTTLQDDLVELMKHGHLSEDKYWHSGRRCIRTPFPGLRMHTLKAMFRRNTMIDDYSEYMERKKRLQLQLLVLPTNRSVPTHAAAAMIGSSSPSLPIKVPPRLTHAKNVLDRARDQNVSLIHSEEMESRRHKYRHSGLYKTPAYFENLRDLLEGWDVTVVVTYRRVFEWMLSSLKQFMGQDTERQRSSSLWPKDGGTGHAHTWTSIREWMNESSTPPHNGQRNTTTVASSYMFMDGVISAWRDGGGFPIHIMNFHDDRHISQQLLCDFIQDAPKSCGHLRQQTENKPKNVRKMAWYAYNGIVFAAAQRGVISQAMQTKKRRLKVVGELADHHGRVLNKTMADLPLDCPPDEELAELLAMSLAVEEEWMPAWYSSPNGEAAHRSAFHRVAYEKREFCNVNLDRLFEGVNTWEDLLEKLK